MPHFYRYRGEDNLEPGVAAPLQPDAGVDIAHVTLLGHTVDISVPATGTSSNKMSLSSLFSYLDTTVTHLAQQNIELR